jgi:hypothetical protein
MKVHALTFQGFLQKVQKYCFYVYGFYVYGFPECIRRRSAQWKETGTEAGFRTKASSDFIQL